LSGIAAATDGKADHGRADTVDHVDHCARVGIEERLILRWNGSLIGCGGLASA